MKEEENMELKTPLYDAHVKAGGKIVPFGGYLLPVQYETGVIKEHMAVRTQGRSIVRRKRRISESPDASYE